MRPRRGRELEPRKLLAVLFTEEVAHRRNTRVQREVRKAGFPCLKTIEDFDFTLQSSLRLALLGSYLGPELMAEGRNLVLFGKTGRGKTHLAVAIGYRAIQNGFTVRFTTAAELIDDLTAPAARRSCARPCPPTPNPTSSSATRSAT